MPDHVIEDADFHIKAPKPVEQLLKEAAEKEKKAEDDAKPAEKGPVKIPDVKEEIAKAAAAPEDAQAKADAAPAFV